MFHSLNPEERYNIWEIYAEKAKDFFRDVEDDLCYKFQPYGKEQDKDAPNAEKLLGMLEMFSGFINAHLEELEHDYYEYNDEQQNAHNAFYAWCYGLCPKITRKASLYFPNDFENVARLKTSRSISKDDTQQAVELWLQNQRQKWQATA